MTHDARLLNSWYKTNKRSLPWRQSRDPYRIWISETMLQQTTTTAVIPYFEKFLQRFPTLKDLAHAPLEHVLDAWSGLGYYSRARNLHKAAQQLNQSGFPNKAAELILLPGFGPYTSRAVSSLAFGERVGVLDGNVIRVISRKHGLKIAWWKTAERKKLQTLADEYVKHLPPDEQNQALMELGATICLPTNPRCALCPWLKSCEAHKHELIASLPLSKPKRAPEIWTWEPQLIIRRKKVALIKNTYAPFLKGQWLLPGTAKKRATKPRSYDFRHTITHHNIFAKVTRLNCDPVKRTESLPDDTIWVALKDIASVCPSSLVKKVLQAAKVT